MNLIHFAVLMAFKNDFSELLYKAYLVLLINLLFKEMFSSKILRKYIINILRQKVIDLDFNCNVLLSIFNGKPDDPIIQRK